MSVVKSDVVVERKYLNTVEAAKMLGVTTQTIRDWIRKGKVTGKKIGGRFFVLRSDIEDVEGVKQDG